MKLFENFKYLSLHKEILMAQIFFIFNTELASIITLNVFFNSEISMCCGYNVCVCLCVSLYIIFLMYFLKHDRNPDCHFLAV